MWRTFFDEHRTRWWLRDCDHVGQRVTLRGQPHIRNPGRIELGSDVSIDSLPVISHLVTGPRGLLQIHDGVSIAHGAAIAAHCHVLLGEGAQLGPFAMILDTDFHRTGGGNEPVEARPIHVGRGVKLGSRVTLLRGARIGDDAIIAPGSVVSGEIPAGAKASGVPARVEGDDAALDSREVPELVRRALGLAELPLLTDGPHSLEAWTSLGSLNLLLSLEAAFGVALRPDEILGVRCVGDLVELVARARTRVA
ncbi:MAG: acyltransferase [Deltaproteobacteria bacterium]|nr:acyltransferase [Deltaproteobacteria bacterium]